MVDLHAHLPQLPNAGLGFALDLLTWLDRLTFPTERSWADPSVAERLAPSIFEAFAAAGTTTVVAYGVVYEAATDAAFRAAEAHGIRAILGKVMMDRGTYDPIIEPSTILDRSLRESADLIEPLARRRRRPARLRGHAALRGLVHGRACCANRRPWRARPARGGRATSREDPFEIAEVRRLFPDALDYVDVYDRAGALGARTILAHAIHLSPREVGRLVETGTHVAHCPASNLFIGAGVMPLARWRTAGPVGRSRDRRVGRARRLARSRSCATGAYAQMARRALAGDEGAILDPSDWLRMGTLDGARALGLADVIGSLEDGKDADMIALDPDLTAALPGAIDDSPDDLLSRLIFRAHPDMVRAAWVRGRRLEGPGARG